MLGVTANADRDCFTITIAPTQFLSAIILANYGSTDRAAFLGVQAGAAFTEDASNPNVANLLGYTLFGPGSAPVSTDLLFNLGAGSGAIGFTGALPNGTYTF